MVKNKKVFLKTCLFTLCWPIMFLFFLFSYMLTPLQILYLLGSLLSLFLHFLNIDGSLVIYACAVPALFIYFAPYFLFLASSKESIVLYVISSCFSFLSAVMGALLILGQHV